MPTETPTPPTSQQWQTEDPNGRLEIPEELLARQRFRWTTTPRDVGLAGTCAYYERVDGGIQLLEVLVDTSQRFQQVVLKKQVTYRTALLLLGAIGVVLFPLNADEQPGPVIR